MGKTIVGLVGPIGAGTSTVRRLLEGHGYVGYGYGQEVAQYVRENGLGEINRSELQHWGDRARRIENNVNLWDERILSKMIEQGWPDKFESGVVLDSLKYLAQDRFWRELAEREGHRFHLLGVNSSYSTRRERVIRRALLERPGDPQTPRAFHFADETDRIGFATLPMGGQDTDACMTLAMNLINNPGNSRESMEHFNQVLELTLRNEGLIKGRVRV